MEYAERLQTFLPSGKKPFDFQIKTGEALLAGNNVILLAPTGAGKTLTALAPLVHAKKEGISFVDRVIYALPMRSLARSLYEKAKVQFENMDLKKGPIIRVTLQVGDQPDDPYFEGDIIFCTIDQLFSSFLTLPVSLPDRVANIPAGALVGSLIVFDEFHLMEINRSLATMVEMNRYLKGVSQFLLMTATAPKQIAEQIAEDMSAKLIEVSDEEVKKIPSQANKQRTYKWINKELTPEVILEHHTFSTLVVVNTVNHAQELYLALKPLAEAQSIPLILLHSRFLANDRAEKEQLLLSTFGSNCYRDWHMGFCERPMGIVIATQVVEVGMDISFDVLHTVLAPANAVVQRAGRCARFEYHFNGQVYVYPPPTDKSGRPRLGPYREQKEVLTQTQKFLEEAPLAPVDFIWERKFVNNVHGEIDLEEYYSVDRKRVRENVRAAFRGERRMLKSLVRDASSISLIIHQRPEELDLSKGIDVFSIPVDTLLGGITNQILEQRPGCIKSLCVSENGDIEWKAIKFVQDAVYSSLISISPEIASYDHEIGLLLGKPGSFVSSYASTKRPRNEFVRYSYRKEYFSEHAKRTALILQDLISQNHIGTSKMATLLKVQQEDFIFLCQLVALLHDTGKLGKKWQQRAWEWQAQKGEQRDGFLAHTDFNGDDLKDWEAYKKLGQVSHAFEGAWYVFEALHTEARKSCRYLDFALYMAMAFCLAIGRHHGGHTVNVDPGFSFAKGAYEEIKRTVNMDEFPLAEEAPPSDPGISLISYILSGPFSYQAITLYLYIVRYLRFADQIATQNATKGGE